MISRIQTLDYRCLRYTDQRLAPFHVLVGPNASGKTSFLDVIAFLSDLVSGGLETAVNERSANFEDILWRKSGARFELAIEALLPESVKDKLPGEKPGEKIDEIRYEVAIGLNEHGEVSILFERGLFKKKKSKNENAGLTQRSLFPQKSVPPESLSSNKNRIRRTIFSKKPGGNDNYYAEISSKSGKGWQPSFKLGPRKSTFGNLPEDDRLFPAATWLKDLLSNGVQKFVLNSLLIRKASPPGQIRHFKPDGSNLPWVIWRLKEKDPESYGDWIEHLKTALPDLEEIVTIERKDDKHRYIVIRYNGGLEVPSWMVSDGTLRLLALTIPAYLTDFAGIYLIEEPENGIHPRAVSTMIQSLSSVYDAQILLATHSPVILSEAEPESVLCFAKDEDGATDIVSGRHHPMLQHWRKEDNLGILFAAGVLG